jgi:sugar phosphate isomerase/epimerase
MRYGCVITPEQLGPAIAAGFDFLELPARDLQPEGNHELVMSTISRTLIESRHPVKVEVFWGLLPPDLPVVGPNVDHARLRRYLHRAFTDMWALGGVLVVLASGATRRIPPGFPRAEAETQFAAMLAYLEAEGERNGLDIALEPLNHTETNLLNTIEESALFLAEKRLQRVRLLVDSYHMMVEGEPLAMLLEHGPLLAHVHVADSNRLPPGQGDMNFLPFFTALRQIGYNGRIALRCDWTDFAREAPQALAFVKRQWEMSNPAKSNGVQDQELDGTRSRLYRG